MKVIGQSRSLASFLRAAGGVLAPLAAAAMAMALSIHMVYSGNLRDSLSSKAETLLIELSLRLRPHVPAVASDVTVVSLTDDDLGTVPLADSPLKDATIDTYLRVLRVVAASNPRFVVLSWLTDAHPDEATRAAELAQVLDGTGLRSRFLLALPFVNDSKIPAELGKLVPVADGDDCIYHVNRICSYPDNWDEWIIKRLADEFWRPIPAHHVSSNLPYLNSYVLNLPDPKELSRLSFRQILGGQPLPANGVYFIGNDVSQDPRFSESKYVLQRTLVFDAQGSKDLQRDGVPFHEFWARLTQMFEGRTTVAIVPTGVERLLAFFYMVGLALVILRLGVAWAFAILLVNALCLPLVNALALSYAGIYLPSFNLIFGGIIVCVVGILISVSWSDYQRFRAASATQHYREVADIKSNFVSLVSHNLNTTVAKLVGLIDIFKGSPLFADQAATIATCDRSIGELFICVRNVLTNLAMYERQHGWTVQPLRRVVDDFNASYGGMLRRLAVEYELELGPDGAGHAPFTGNVRVLHQCLASLLSLGEAFAAEGCLLTLALDDETRRLGLSLKYYLPRHPAAVLDAFAAPGDAGAEDAGTQGFPRLTLEFVREVVAWTHGTLEAQASGGNVVVTASLDFAHAGD